MKIVDISDSTSPTLLGSYDISKIQDIAISTDNRRAYLSIRERGLLILDISNSASPFLLGEYKCSYGAIIILSETKIYIDGNIIDVSNPTTPTLVGTSSVRSDDIALSPDNKRVYSVNYSGLNIVDISNPTSPITIGHKYSLYSNHLYAIDLSKDGTKAYLASTNSELHIVDVTSVANIFGWYNISGNIKDISLSSDGTRAYLATGINGLQIIDLTISIHHKPKNFTDTLLKLEINNNISKDMKLTVSTDRSDIITIGDYPKTLTYKEYQKQDVKIPISSVSDAVGQTIITLTLSNDKETTTRKVYFNVYP